MRKLLLLLVSLFSTVQWLHAQPETQPDVMRSNGKIYVVMAVVVVIVTGLLLYVLNTDRKISRLEKEFRKGQ
jgi:CcmD family protein